jgi:signal recognition particle receptor subunit beta
MHRATRKVVLAGVDAVAFIADSQRDAASANAYSYRDLEANMRANGIDVQQMPQVVQFNKRDLPDVKPLEEVRKAWEGTGIPTVPAVAVRGEGVVETFEALLGQLYQHLNERHDFARKFGIRQEDFLQGVVRDLRDKPQNS